MNVANPGMPMVLGWGLFAFMALHIIGVILAEKSDQSGLVSRMINGKKTVEGKLDIFLTQN